MSKPVRTLNIIYQTIESYKLLLLFHDMAINKPLGRTDNKTDIVVCSVPPPPKKRLL